MGDRISFSFVNPKADFHQESIAFFSHWDGRSLLGVVQDYHRELKKELNKRRKSKIRTPIDRLEPETVMVDFLRWFLREKEFIDGNYYLGKDGNDGDNSDNGHWRFDLKAGTWEGS